MLLGIYTMFTVHSPLQLRDIVLLCFVCVGGYLHGPPLLSPSALASPLSLSPLLTPSAIVASLSELQMVSLAAREGPDSSRGPHNNRITTSGSFSAPLFVITMVHNSWITTLGSLFAPTFRYHSGHTEMTVVASLRLIAVLRCYTYVLSPTTLGG